jgi:iron(III) transport system substrate-binding protein
VTRASKSIVCALAATLLLAGCAEREKCDVVVYTYLEQLYAEPPLLAFEQQTGKHVCPTYPSFETKASGILGKLLEEGDKPKADVLWAEDPIQPWVLVQKGMVVPYLSNGAAQIPPAFKDASGLWTGVAAQARVLLVNTKLVPQNAWPLSIRSLADPRWKGRTAMGNPLHGTTLVQMAAFAANWGEKETRQFLDERGRNGVHIATTSWAVKEMVQKGAVAFGVTNTDHAYESLHSGAPVAVIYPDQEKSGLGTLVMPASVWLLAGPHRDVARQLIDFLLTPPVEEMLTRDGAYFSLRPGAPAADRMKSLDQFRPMQVDFAHAGAALQRIKPWIEDWLHEQNQSDDDVAGDEGTR